MIEATCNTHSSADPLTDTGHTTAAMPSGMAVYEAAASPADKKLWWADEESNSGGDGTTQSTVPQFTTLCDDIDTVLNTLEKEIDELFDAVPRRRWHQYKHEDVPLANTNLRKSVRQFTNLVARFGIDLELYDTFVKLVEPILLVPIQSRSPVIDEYFIFDAEFQKLWTARWRTDRHSNDWCYVPEDDPRYREG